MPSRSQLHDALWTRFHEIITKLFGYADQLANPLEYRMLWCVQEMCSRLSADWPSRVRNLVNYLPGGAYREVIRATEIDAAQYVRRRLPFNAEKLVSTFEDEVVHGELIERSSGDRRCSNARRTFLQTHCSVADPRAFWPLSTV